MNALTSRSSSRAWLLPAARSFAALLPGLGVVFVQDHSMHVGFTIATVFFLGTAIAMFALARQTGDARMRFLVLGSIHGLAAFAAFAVLLVSPQQVVFLGLVALWAFATAAVEFSATKLASEEGGPGLGRDWRTVAIGTGLFGLLMAFSPLLGIADAVSLTGLFGAYAAIVGVYHAIAAASAAFGSRVTGEAAAKGLESES
ncbi:hypothetical protein [uncultured Agrococcus sp.]|uniref:hypothetical protein n=1 Tax=uncultured Agrococcus sp. TaxID=382258 RepID=UPI0025FCCCDD|nr:hypothetical protein [uncultured Agrococcus sp.]